MSKKFLKIFCLFIIGISGILFIAGCNTNMGFPKTPYTPGNASLVLKKGITTKEEVLKAFGAPNIVTQDGDGNSVWTYQVNATVTRAAHNDTAWTILLVGGDYGDSGFMRSQRTMTLIITFKGNVVSNFRSMYTSF